MSLVTAGRFRDPHVAHIARAALEAEDIPAFVMNDLHVGLDWVLSNALGGVRLQVMEKDLESAREFLAAEHEPPAVAFDPEPEATERCPRCNSLRIAASPIERRTKALSLLVNFPFTWRTGVWQCLACGHDWRPQRPYRSLLAIASYLFGLMLLLLEGIATLLLLVPAQARRLILFGQRTYRCWSCGTSYAQDATRCPGCGIRLPSPTAYERLVVEGDRYDDACPNCHLPYRVTDYAPGRAPACSWCKTALPIGDEGQG